MTFSRSIPKFCDISMEVFGGREGEREGERKCGVRELSERREDVDLWVLD